MTDSTNPRSHLTITRAGLFTTVQDSGRPDHLHLGLAFGGAMDVNAMRLANELVGNSAYAAVLELTMHGDSIELPQETLVALTGARFDATLSTHDRAQLPMPYGTPVLLPAGSTLNCGTVTRGCRGCLAVAGGIDVPVVLGSRSTLTRCGFGGFAGRPLRSGDVLPIGLPSNRSQRLIDALRLRRTAQDTVVSPDWFATSDSPHASSTPTNVTTLSVVRGPQFDWLDDASRQALLSSSLRVSHQSDRMGFRLTVEPTLTIRQASLPSSGTVMGMIQVPPDGNPILLMADAAPTGGYPVVATVIRADLSSAAQLRPGDAIRLHEIAMEVAHERLREQRRQLNRTLTMISLRTRSH